MSEMPKKGTSIEIDGVPYLVVRMADGRELARPTMAYPFEEWLPLEEALSFLDASLARFRLDEAGEISS